MQKEITSTKTKSMNKTSHLIGLHNLFVKITKEEDISIFLATCQLLLLDMNYEEVNYLKKSDIDSEYKESLVYLTNDIPGFEKFINEYEFLKSNFKHSELITVFSDFYESQINKTARAKLGAFYTPITYCVEAHKELAREKKYNSVFDPFCGGGAWLCAFLMSRENTLFEINNPPIYGTDIDRNAIFLARLNVFILLPKTLTTFLALNRQIVQLNTLYPNTLEEKTLKSFSDDCDIIVTNPPYGFAVDEKNKYYETILSKVPDKEVYYYAIESIRRRQAINKKTVFLVPNSFMFNMGAQEFRDEISNSFDVKIWDHSDSDIFRSATVRTALIQLAKKTTGSKVTILKSFGKKTLSLSLEKFIAGEINKKVTLKNFKDTLPLNTFFEVSQGLIPYDKYRGHTSEQISKRIFHSNKKLTSEFKKELQGKDVTSFKVSWNGENWIKYGTWLAAPRSPKFFKEQRVLIREITHTTTGKISCAYCEQEFYNTPSLINVICKSDKGQSIQLKTLAVLLSTSDYSNYHLQNSPKAKKGLFPKILVNDVRNLPLPKNFLKLDYSKIYDRAAEMKELGSSDLEISTFIESAITRNSSKKAA